MLVEMLGGALAILNGFACVKSADLISGKRLVFLDTAAKKHAGAETDFENMLHASYQNTEEHTA